MTKGEVVGGRTREGQGGGSQLAMHSTLTHAHSKKTNSIKNYFGMTTGAGWDLITFYARLALLFYSKSDSIRKAKEKSKLI